MARVTLRDVARAAGVHFSTASRVLDEAWATWVSLQTVARVRRAAEQLGYQPHIGAKGLRRGQTFTIGVVVADLGNPYIAPVVRGIENSLEPAGFMTLIAETQDDPVRFERVLLHLAGRRVDAIITTSARFGNFGLLRRFAEQTAPVVLAVRGLPGSGLPTVRADDVRGGELAAGYLMELGHRRLAQLVGPQDMQPFTDRAEGFTRAVHALGGELVAIAESASVPTYEEGHRLMVHLLAAGQPRPSAVFVHNDPMAIGALDVAAASGLCCPADVSIIGFNDNPFVDHVSPPLSTIRIPGYEIGRRASDMALAMLTEGPGRQEDITLPPQLVPRASTRRVG